MAVTFGFYNSKNGDRVYNAEQMSSLFAGIIKDGVFENYPNEGDHLKVSHVSGFKMSIGPGRAWFENTWTDNDAPYEIELTPPVAGNDRIDLIVLEINKTNDPDNNSDIYPFHVPGRSNRFVVLKGTPAPQDQAVRPTPRNGNGIYQHPIAVVRVSSRNMDAIYSFDRIVGVSSYTPFIANALGSIDAEDVIDSWTNALNAAILQFHDNGQQEIDSVVAEYFEDPNSEVYQQIEDLSATLRSEIRTAVDEAEPIVVWFRNVNGNFDSNAVYSEIDSAVVTNHLLRFEYVYQPVQGSGGKRGTRTYHCYNFYRERWDYPAYVANSKTYHVEFIDDSHSEIVRVNIERGERTGNDTGSYQTIVTYEIIPLKPLEAHFSVENNTAVCDKTFAEISAAIMAGRELNLICDSTETNRIKMCYSYTLNAAGTAVQTIRAYVLDMWPEGLDVQDWGWDCISFSYTSSQLSYNISTQ